jgi:hypothetical protein
LGYYQAHRTTKCKLFMLTLKGAAMTTQSIFISQRKEESLRDYIERFTRETIEVKGTNDKLKCYIFEKGLRSDIKFKEKLHIKEQQDMHDLLSHAQNYINYEETLQGEKAEKAKIPPRKDESVREKK